MQALLAAAKWAAVQVRARANPTRTRTRNPTATPTPNPTPTPTPNSNPTPNQARQASDAAETRALGAERVATEVP